MKISEMKAKLDELKTVNPEELTDEQKAEVQSLEKSIGAETGELNRLKELSEKDENLLTSEEVDELIQLNEKHADDTEEPDDTPPASVKKYAGKYDSVDDLIKGIQSSEQEKERILKEHPELVEELEGKYKGSQRDVSKMVRKIKEPEVRRDVSRVPLSARDLHEMTQGEYDKWEKEDKLSAHTWLSEATRKESLRVESRKKVFARYPQFYAMAQGVVDGDDKWKAFDKLAAEHPEWMRETNGAELCMAEMEKELNIDTPKPKQKPVVLKPGFEQGKASTSRKAGGASLSEEEFSALSEDEQIAYMTGSIERKGK